MDKKTRIVVAKILLKLAKQVKAQDPMAMVDEGVETEKLVKMNPQLNTIARRLNSLGLSTSDMLTAVLMAMRLRGEKAEANRAFNLMRPMLKKIV